MRQYAPLLLLLPWTLDVRAQSAAASADSQALVQRALAGELQAAQDESHPMRYRLRKTSPRLTSTKLLIETKDGLVARLVSINDQPLSPADEKNEQDRLDGLLSDPGKQKHRKQSEDADAERALKVLRVLPRAFLYEPAADAAAAGDGSVCFHFKPNPAFDAPDLETQVLSAMSGEIWIDPAQARVLRLEGRLERDVDFGWGILGKLEKGGSISIEQTDTGGGQWRIAHFRMKMAGRVFFKTKVFDTTEDESDFAPVPAGLDYARAIEMLRAADKPAVQGAQP